MPLLKGKKNIGKNIKELKKTGKSLARNIRIVSDSSVTTTGLK